MDLSNLGARAWFRGVLLKLNGLRVLLFVGMLDIELMPSGALLS